jgi:AraC-like DNA-binding protein
MKQRPDFSMRRVEQDHAALVGLLAKLVGPEGFLPTALPEVRLFHSRGAHPPRPIVYEPSIVIVAQGSKRGRLGNRTFVYDAGNYLVLSLPLPFECQTLGRPEEPMLAFCIRVSPIAVAELVLASDPPLYPGTDAAQSIDAAPVTPDLLNAAVRLARCLNLPPEDRVLGPQLVREIIYRVLCGPRGNALRALATPQSKVSQIARSLRRIHLDFARPLDVGLLAREASMSPSTFHANFKAVTSQPPQRYLQTIRLHKAHAIIAGGAAVSEAARQVGYESPSQFSREFKRLFGGTPKDFGRRHRSLMFAF